MTFTSVLLFLIVVPDEAPRAPMPAACPPGAPIAIEGASILTMDSAALLRDATILVQAGKVAAINPPSLPVNSCRIAARAKFIVPGLSDIHVHTNARELPIFLANGVTLVREMNGTPAHVALRERIARGEIAGPRLLVTSPLLVGTPLQYRHKLITSADEAYKAAHDAKDAGYDFLKIYDGLSLAAYDALVEAGRTLGLRLDGHIPVSVGLERVLNAGQAIQHMDKIAMALGGHGADSGKLDRARRLFTGKRAWVTPTIASLRVLDAARTVEYANWLDRPEMAYVDSSSLGWWRSLSGSGPARARSEFYNFQVALLPILRAAGVRVLLGTDAANPMMVAGFAVHEELATLQRDGGFSAFDALLSATKNVGEFLDDSLRGRIVVGAPADLIIADANPLEDLATLRKPAGVLVNGRWYDRQQLDSLLASTRQR
ncbi:MAG: amidohydrolase family protein [Gemmatimonadota bacterium]